MAISRRLAHTSFAQDTHTQTHTEGRVVYKAGSSTLEEEVLNLLRNGKYSEFVNKTRILLAWGIPNAVIADFLGASEGLVEETEKRLVDINILP